MDRHRAVRAAGAAMLFMVTAPAASAWASGWLPPVGGDTMILGFGASYAGGTHRGVDLAAEVGAPVSSPTDAVVTFAGAVPADGGGTCGAVTLELGDGQRVSLLPLDGVGVAEGDSVRAGDPIGAVASRGDDSSEPAHLHIGLRRGDLYLDPTALLAPSAATEPEVAPQSVVIPQVPTESAMSAGGRAMPAAAAHATAVPAAVPGGGWTSAGEAATASAGVTSVSARGSATRIPIRDAGTPRPSSVVVQGANAMSRQSAHIGLPAARVTTAWLLALGMFGVGVSIVVVRRASPVHVR